MSKTEAEGILKISTSFLRKDGYFRGHKRSGVISWTGRFSGKTSSVVIEVSTSGDIGFLRIQYTQTPKGAEDGKDFDYQIPLTATPCRFGGNRYWFKCPWYKNDKFCGRRVGVLYKDGDHFACRHCYNITYASRNENRRHISMFPQFGILDIEKKMVEQQKRVKVPYYRGRTTKQQQKLDRIWDEYVAFANKYILLE